MKQVEIIVVQQPTDVCFECPECEEEVEIDYRKFCSDVGEPCDWNYATIECPECNKKIEIDSVDWN